MNGLVLADRMTDHAALTPAEVEDFRAWRRSRAAADEPGRRERRLAAARELATLPAGSETLEQVCRDNAPPWQAPAASLARAAKAAPIEMPQRQRRTVDRADLKLPLLGGGHFDMAPMLRELEGSYKGVDVPWELEQLADWVSEDKPRRAPGYTSPGNYARPEGLIHQWLDRAATRTAFEVRALRAARAERIRLALELIDVVHLQPELESVLAASVRRALQGIPVPDPAIEALLRGVA